MYQWRVKYKAKGASIILTALVQADSKNRAEYLAKQMHGQDIILCGTEK